MALVFDSNNRPPRFERNGDALAPAEPGAPLAKRPELPWFVIVIAGAIALWIVSKLFASPRRRRRRRHLHRR